MLIFCERKDRSLRPSSVEKLPTLHISVSLYVRVGCAGHSASHRNSTSHHCLPSLLTLLPLVHRPCLCISAQAWAAVRRKAELTEQDEDRQIAYLVRTWHHKLVRTRWWAKDVGGMDATWLKWAKSSFSRGVHCPYVCVTRRFGKGFL